MGHFHVLIAWMLSWEIYTWLTLGMVPPVSLPWVEPFQPPLVNSTRAIFRLKPLYIAEPANRPLAGLCLSVTLPISCILAWEMCPSQLVWPDWRTLTYFTCITVGG